MRSKGGRCLFCHKREETKDGDLVLALDVMTQTPIVALPSDVWIERGRGEELQKKKYREWRLCVVSLTEKAVLPISEPLFI